MTHKLPAMADRPRCCVAGCDRPKMPMGQYNKSGEPQWRKICSKHHNNHLATRNGFESVTEFKNSTHPYLQFRKKHCENIDGRFGFTCTAEIQISAQLQVDHKNGNPHDNNPRNLQTLCANCHIFKTIKCKDYATPGRKTLRCTPSEPWQHIQLY